MGTFLIGVAAQMLENSVARLLTIPIFIHFSRKGLKGQSRAILTLSLTAPCGRNSLTAKNNAWPTKVWAYFPKAVRSFLFYANHVAASVHSSTVQYRAQKSAHTQQGQTFKMPSYIKAIIASEPYIRLKIQKQIQNPHKKLYILYFLHFFAR